MLTIDGRRHRMRLGALAGIAMLCVPMQSHAQTTDIVKDAARLTAAGKAQAAYSLLVPQLLTRAGEPDFDYVLGLAAADSGHHAQAIQAFQRVLAVQPDNLQARAELARAYAGGGDIDTAKAEFDRVLADPAVPDPVRRRLDGVVTRYNRQIAGGSTEVRGYVDTEGGVDSNINSATDATAITLPLFGFLGPATLNAGARQQDDGYYQVQAGLSVSTPLSRQTSLYGSILGNWRDNFSSNFVDQASLVGSVGVAHQLATGDILSLSAQAQKFWLDYNGYRTSLGAIGQYSWRLSNDRAVSVSAQYYRLNYDNNPALDAQRFAAALTYSDRNLYGGIGGGKEQTRRPTADHLGFAFVNGQLGGELPVNPRLVIIGGVSAEYRHYDKVDPLFLMARRDVQVDVSLGARYLLTSQISIRPRATYTRNSSNLALYDYHRWTAGVALRVEF